MAQPLAITGKHPNPILQHLGYSSTHTILEVVRGCLPARRLLVAKLIGTDFRNRTTGLTSPKKDGNALKEFGIVSHHLFGEPIEYVPHERQRRFSRIVCIHSFIDHSHSNAADPGKELRFWKRGQSPIREGVRSGIDPIPSGLGICGFGKITEHQFLDFSELTF